MQALVDRHAFVNAVQAAGVVVALFEFDERQAVRPVAIDLVGAGEAERRFAAEIAGSHQHIHGAESIHIEIVVGYGCRLVMGRLRRGMNDELRPSLSNTCRTAWRSRMSMGKCR